MTWTNAGTNDRISGYFVSNLIVSCAQPEAGGPFGEVSGR